MKAGGGFARALLVFTLAVAGLGACGGDAADQIALLASAEWRQDPGSVGDVGYHVQVDVGWIDRAGRCARIPGVLRVTVNQIEAIRIGTNADCDFDALFDAGPFTVADPVTVRLFERDRVVGEATFEGMFWGMQARLVSPAGGQIYPGDEVVASIPPGKDPPSLEYADWYWLDAAPSVPPFYTPSSAEIALDDMTMSALVPDQDGLSGRVALTFPYGFQDIVAATACTFSSCVMYARYSLGPIALEVLAP